MKITSQINWVKGSLADFGQLPQKAEKARGLGLQRTAQLLRDTIVGTYVGAGHPDHPEVITGRLKASIRYAPTNPTTEVYVGSDADYAPYVEFGHTQEPGRFVPALGKRLVSSEVKPYPFFRPAISEVFDSGNAQKLFANTIKEVLGI